ncbi:MAG: hypothetical protein V2I47_04745 [Bacteroidales bacterium]|nr:hypothetical protein [Bacteroidales bacterium]
MKKIIYLLIAIPLMISCSKGVKNAENNISVVESYIEAVENLDYETMETLLDESYQGLGPSFGDSISKDQALESWKYNVEHLYENIKYSRLQVAPVHIEQGYNRGEWVSSWAELQIKYKDGNMVTIWANAAYKVENGKIVKTFTFYNEADALRQLGYVFINPNDL